MTKKYLVVPGYVRSKVDSQLHWVPAVSLARLYGVSLDECEIAAVQPRGLQHKAIDYVQYAKDNNLTILRPRYDGNYSLEKL